MNLLLIMAPQYQSRDELHTTTQNLADEPTFTDGTPLGTRAEMTCKPLHKTCQMNLLWPMDPPVPKQRWLQYQYNKLGRQTYTNQWNLSVPEWRWLANHYTKLGRWTYFHWWNSPGYQSRDDLHTTTQNLADEPTLAKGPISTSAEMTCIPLHKMRQMNLNWPMDPTCNTATQNLPDEPTLTDRPILDSSRKGGNFLLFLNN